MRIFNKFAPRITSTASATTFYPYISMCANCDFCENIAWVFGVNRVFGVFLIYPIYPKKPKYYLFIFYSPFLQAIRITDSFSFDYADLPCRLIALSPPSTDFLRTHSQPSSKVRRNLSLITYSSSLVYPFLPALQYSILIYAAWRKWRLWRKLLRHSAISATCTFLTQKKVFFCPNACVYAFFVVPLHPKWWFTYHQIRCFYTLMIRSYGKY